VCQQQGALPLCKPLHDLREAGFSVIQIV
jgi:hypothetical protein